MNKETYSYNPTVKSIKQTLHRPQVQVVFIWIPSHVSTSNEEADRNAKQAIMNEESAKFVKCSCFELKRFFIIDLKSVRRKIEKKLQTYLEYYECPTNNSSNTYQATH